MDYQPVMNFDQQLQARASTKDLPDVMINHTALMGSYQSQGLLKPIVPGAVPGHGRISGQSWASTVGRDGKHYGIPYSRQAMTLMIRKDWLSKLGRKAPKTWRRMIDVAKPTDSTTPPPPGIGDGGVGVGGAEVTGSGLRGESARRVRRSSS
ncbi:extracellular solute-binding protein [Streptomyces sp. NPDC001544]|uniref:extracellular solute-binding protein n=1 Tax=Streptomyces sp. NPDC001544 TaxID=3364584 RepID=UPI0036C597CB